MRYNRAMEDEQALLQRIQAGDKAACAVCIDRFAPSVYRLALRLTGDSADAEDVMQETFLNAFNAIDTFEGRSGLGTWLYRITYNNAMMRLRRPAPPVISVDDALQQGDDGFSVPRQLFDWCCLPERDVTGAEVHAELERAIAALPETLRAVFVLRELEELSTQATAAALDLSEAAVKKRLQRARLWLRERLSDYFAGQHG